MLGTILGSSLSDWAAAAMFAAFLIGLIAKILWYDSPMKTSVKALGKDIGYLLQRIKRHSDKLEKSDDRIDDLGSDVVKARSECKLVAAISEHHGRTIDRLEARLNELESNNHPAKATSPE